MVYSIDFIIYLGENTIEFGFVIGLSCVKGMKKIFFLFISFPIFSAFVLNPSFVAIPIRTGKFFRRCAFAETRTGVSYIEDASFAILFPRAWSNN